MIKNKFITTVIVTVVLYGAWEISRPVEIVAVHNGRVLLVRNFPYFNFLQVEWWESNKEKIHDKYGIPMVDDEGSYNVAIQGFGDGYKIKTDHEGDLLCFNDMEEPANCIEKNPLMGLLSVRGGEADYR